MMIGILRNICFAGGCYILLQPHLQAILYVLLHDTPAQDAAICPLCRIHYVPCLVLQHFSECLLQCHVLGLETTQKL